MPATNASGSASRLAAASAGLDGPERHEADCGDGERDPGHRGRSGPLAAPERVGDRNERARHRRHRGDDADKRAGHGRVEAHEAEPDGEAASHGPRRVRRRHPVGVDDQCGRQGEHESDELRHGRDADRVDRPREEAADEVGAADEQRRRDGQDGRHAWYPRTPVTTADRVTAAGDLRRCDDGRDRPAEAELVERYRADPLLHPGDRSRALSLRRDHDRRPRPLSSGAGLRLGGP